MDVVELPVARLAAVRQDVAGLVVAVVAVVVKATTLKRAVEPEPVVVEFALVADPGRAVEDAGDIVQVSVQVPAGAGGVGASSTKLAAKPATVQAHGAGWTHDGQSGAVLVVVIGVLANFDAASRPSDVSGPGVVPAKLTASTRCEIGAPVQIERRRYMRRAEDSGVSSVPVAEVAFAATWHSHLGTPCTGRQLASACCHRGLRPPRFHFHTRRHDCMPMGSPRLESEAAGSRC